MNIVYDWPPNIGEIREHFEIPSDRHVYFSYFPSLYSPTDHDVPQKYIVHERVHFDQQMFEENADIWWRKYIDDPEFRLSQEYPAYGAQVRYVRITQGRGAAEAEANMAAEVLASPIYGDCVSFNQAKSQILRHSL